MTNTFKPILTPQDMTTAERNLITSLLIKNAKELEDEIRGDRPIHANEFHETEVQFQRNLAKRIMMGVQIESKQDLKKNSIISNETTLSDNLVSITEDTNLLEIGRSAIEKELIEFRDSGLSEMHRRNGLVIRYKDGSESDIIRFGPETGLRIGLRAIAEHLKSTSQGKSTTSTTMPLVASFPSTNAVAFPPYDGVMCDKHSNTPSFKRVLDTTGAHDVKCVNMCQHCYDLYLVTTASAVTGHCDWCVKDSVGVLPVKDPDEGEYGPIHYACKACRLST